MNGYFRSSVYIVLCIKFIGDSRVINIRAFTSSLARLASSLRCACLLLAVSLSCLGVGDFVCNVHQHASFCNCMLPVVVTMMLVLYHVGCWSCAEHHVTSAPRCCFVVESPNSIGRCGGPCGACMTFPPGASDISARTRLNVSRSMCFYVVRPYPSDPPCRIVCRFQNGLLAAVGWRQLSLERNC